MAPLTADMRLRAAIEPLASTRKRIRFPSRPSLMVSRRSAGRTTRLVPSRPRALWCGAAALIVAARATSLALPGFSRSATGCPVSPETRLLRPSGPPAEKGPAPGGRVHTIVGTVGRVGGVFGEDILEFLGIDTRLFEGAA